MIGAPGQDDAGIDLTIISGDPTDAELAAVAAVLTAMTEEMSATASSRAPAPVSAWSRSQRAIRPRLTPGVGAWRGFTA